MLNETRNEKTKVFREGVLEPLLEEMWNKLKARFPAHAQHSCAMTPEEFSYPSRTGFAQVTMAHNNPTRWHYDAGNAPGTMTCIYILTDGEPIEGGEQVLKNGFGDDAVVIESCNGLLIMGDYTCHLHAVLEVLRGNRMVVIAYSHAAIAVYSGRYVPPGMTERQQKRETAKQRKQEKAEAQKQEKAEALRQEKAEVQKQEHASMQLVASEDLLDGAPLKKQRIVLNNVPCGLQLNKFKL